MSESVAKPAESASNTPEALILTVEAIVTRWREKGPSRYRAGVILHHSRKEQQFGRQNYSVSAMRGASSIHSEVDLAIATFQLDEKIFLNYSNKSSCLRFF